MVCRVMDSEPSQTRNSKRSAAAQCEIKRTIVRGVTFSRIVILVSHNEMNSHR